MTNLITKSGQMTKTSNRKYNTGLKRKVRQDKVAYSIANQKMTGESKHLLFPADEELSLILSDKKVAMVRWFDGEGYWHNVNLDDRSEKEGVIVVTFQEIKEEAAYLAEWRWENTMSEAAPSRY